MAGGSEGSWSDVTDGSPQRGEAAEQRGGHGDAEEQSTPHSGLGESEGESEGASPQGRGLSEAERMQEDWQDSLTYQENILHAHRTAPEVEGRWEDRCLKIMVVGESGQGKTTFIQNMFMAYMGEQAVAMADGSVTSMADFVADPAALCTCFTVPNEEERVRYHFSVQDTPGYGDDLNIANNIRVIVDYVEQCCAAFYAAEVEHGRPDAAAADCRVDVCLYFAAAHRLKPVDVQFMAALAPHVAVIPVIAKADCMTTDEVAAYRAEVVARLANPAADGVPEPVATFAFSDSAKQAAGVSHAVPPFAVVSSNQTDPTVGPYWPVRRYNWGTCEAFRSRDSDFAALKRLVLELSYWDIRDATEARYKEYRRQRRAVERGASKAAAAAAQAGAAGPWSSTLRGWADAARAAAAKLGGAPGDDKAPAAPGTLRGPTAAGAADADSLGTLAGLLGPAALLALLLLALGGTVLHVGGREPSMDSALHYLADIREREQYIAQLQGEAAFLLEALTARSGGALPAECAAVAAGDAPLAARTLAATISQYVYGDMCYDEEYKAGVPWAVQLLLSGCVVFSVWSAAALPALQALPHPGARLAARGALYGAGLLCLFHLQHAFAAALL